jgi:hypothetical protein
MKIDFEFETQYGVFRDVISLPDNHLLNESDIEAIKLERLSNFIYNIENPPVVATEVDYIEIDGVKYLKAE